MTEQRQPREEPPQGQQEQLPTDDELSARLQTLSEEITAHLKELKKK